MERLVRTAKKQSSALNHEIPWREFEVTGEQSVMTNTIKSSFCQNNHCIICKDTSALNKIRVISSYSALLGSTSVPPSLTQLSWKHMWCSSKANALMLLAHCKGDEMYHEMLQSDHCPGYGASPINLLYTKQSPWMHTAVLWHLLKLQHKMHITCDQYWPDTKIKRLMSQAIVSPIITEIWINQLNKHFYQHDQTQQIDCVCLNTTFREMQKFLNAYRKFNQWVLKTN